LTISKKLETRQMTITYMFDQAKLQMYSLINDP